MQSEGAAMIRRILYVLFALALIISTCAAQELPAKWEELTAPDFVKAIQKSNGLCLLPFGIVEKHGPSGPLGTDLLNIRYVTMQAVKQEYAVVFPEYYFGQIFEAQHQPGTIVYSSRLQLEMLDETTKEMARNGCKKIVIVNGHGGNTGLLEYYGMRQLESPRDYYVYIYFGGDYRDNAKGASAPSAPGVDGHAGEGEISNVMAHRPDLAHPERGKSQSGADLDRVKLPKGVYAGIWWYAKFPNHYQGDASGATAKRGEAVTKVEASALVDVIRAVKADESVPKLMKQFFDEAQHPLDTKQ
jgi:creatinine amidohydrolase